MLRNRIIALEKKIQPHSKVLEVWYEIDDLSYKVVRDGKVRFEDLKAADEPSESYIKRIFVTYE